MKTAFKPLGIAAAVAAASIGQVQAQTVANNNLGDLALVPYYTVAEGWVTGIHIVNTSEHTQVVKFRFRRATDSMDALDFNIVMSPFDVYAGFLSDEDGTVSWQADDTTCTVPATTDGKLTMPPIYRPDAETGYVEIIAMGQPEDEGEPIAIAAKHAKNDDDEFIPASCQAVRSNFFADGDATTFGVVDNMTTHQDDETELDLDGPAVVVPTVYEDSENVLKVSYSITDVATGIEFGDNAVHIQDFLSEPTLTNQQYGVFSGDLNGFDFPDLNGATPVNGGTRGTFEALRSTDVLGVASLANEWSANPANEVATDWVVTLPGQYTMLSLPSYVAAMEGDAASGFEWVPTLSMEGAPIIDGPCPRVGEGDPTVTDIADACDARDMPVELTFVAYNREEGEETVTSDGLVVSPAPPGIIEARFLPKEANVITFGDTGGVLAASDQNITAPTLIQPFGWLSVGVDSITDDDTEIGVCEWDPSQDGSVGDSGFPSASAGAALDNECANFADAGGVPVIGFAAWARSIAANPDGSYGRIIAHSFSSN